MDAIEGTYMKEQTTAANADQLPSPCSPVRDGIYDEPQAFCRIGDEYQAAVPSLELESKCVNTCLTRTISKLLVEHDVGVGLAIPVMWVNHEGNIADVEQRKISDSIAGSTKGLSMDDENTMKYEPGGVSKMMGVQSPKCENECIDLANHCKKPSGCNTKEKTAKKPSGCNTKERTAPEYKMRNGVLQQLRETKGYIPLPGLSSYWWSDDAKQSFLLGLYIFGKDLVRVKNFINCKNIGDVLCFYYGQFFRSDAYCRWSSFRRVKGRKCILGHRLFTGWRQQEILSRVLPSLPKDSQDTLLEVTNALNEGIASLEEFVCVLKETLGMQTLVGAIGIGSGKHDITGMSDPVRTNQPLSSRSEIPVGKACSSLATDDIVKFLTGDFRLSKAKSNDLFWEAVWPRLLARGWHSEQPKDISVVSKNSLVFLLPGIKKFSRKKLLKGHHYFDSISDVLNKVASDPSLLELEAEGAAESNNARNVNGHATITTSIQNGPFDHQHRSNFCPRVTISNSELIKFTVVDTSMVQGEGLFKVRELRSLPFDAFNNYGLLSHTGDLENYSSEDSKDEGNFDPDSSSYDKKPKVGKKDTIGREEHPDTIGREEHPTSSNNAPAFVGFTLPLNGKLLGDSYFNQRKESESQLICRFFSEKQSFLAPTAKQRKLSACKNDQTRRHTCSFSKNHLQMEKRAQPKLGSLEENHKIVSEAEPIHGVVHSGLQVNTSSDRVGNCASEEEIFCNATTIESSYSEGMPESRSLIDLNLLPYYSSDYENGEHSGSELAYSQHDLNEGTNSKIKPQHDGSVEMHDVSGVLGDQHPSVNVQRQSTRYRPPTSRALEALAMGFLGTKQTGRDTSALFSGNKRNRSSRR